MNRLGDSKTRLQVIGEDTRVRLGFAAAVLGGAIWWAASLQAKMDLMGSQVTVIIADHEARIRSLERKP